LIGCFHVDLGQLFLIGCFHVDLGHVLPQFELASYYASNMVLQRPPARPRIWGYAVNVGDAIVIELVTGSQKWTVSAVSGKIKSL